MDMLPNRRNGRIRPGIDIKTNGGGWRRSAQDRLIGADVDVGVFWGWVSVSPGLNPGLNRPAGCGCEDLSGPLRLTRPTGGLVCSREPLVRIERAQGNLVVSRFPRNTSGVSR